MVITEMDEIDNVVEESKNRILSAIDVKMLNDKKDASFDLRLICMNVLEDLKGHGKIVSYENALVLKTQPIDRFIPKYDLEYILAFRIKDGAVHRYIYCDNVLERKENDSKKEKN